MTTDERLLDLIQSPTLRLFVLNPDFDYRDNVPVTEGPLVINNFLSKLGLLYCSDVIIQTVTGNNYYLSSTKYHGDRDGVIIEWINPAEWNALELYPDSDVVAYSPDFISELQHFKLVSLVMEFNNAHVFWWGTPVHESLLVSAFKSIGVKITDLWNTPFEAFEDVKLKAVTITDYLIDAIEVDYGTNRYYHNELKLSDEVTEQLNKLHHLLTVENPVPMPSAMIFDDSVSLVRDIQSGKWYSHI